jgi:hypothetical protein
MKPPKISHSFFWFSGFMLIISIILVCIAYSLYEPWSHHFIRTIGKSIIALFASFFFVICGFSISFLGKKITNLFSKKDKK